MFEYRHNKCVGSHVERYITLRPEYPKHTYTQKYPHTGAHLIKYIESQAQG